MQLIDKEARHLATDPLKSFIVQAPAGSGKTEILTQRYLRLLGTVKHPEQIIALTFTRKAASEMRERILVALEQAAVKKKAASPHYQLTLQFASDALKQSQLLGWDLLNQPTRLKINTIDSLCQTINQAIPLLEKNIAFPNVTEKAETYYLKASRACIQYAIKNQDYQKAITVLLLHLDNRQDRLIELFTSLLSQRDQWIHPFFMARHQSKTLFEYALKNIENHALQRLKESLPFTIANELVRLTRELATIENNPDSPRSILSHWRDFQEINQSIAYALTTTILTSTGGIRKSFDHNIGLKKGSCSNVQYEELKVASQELLMSLSEQTDFIDTLIQASRLPKPEYAPEQWDVLQALFSLLPLLIGHLEVAFGEKNEVDFTAIAQNALHALGSTDNPTDLALYFDNAIHHLLVDEFQDTSIAQFELLNQLVQGWQEGDGKTLFVVGDPMQSIYRFRQAEVGLFYQAKEHGIGPVQLHFLQLSCNFRSTKTIINWVNQQFSHIFPQHFDIESGAVSFHSSVNVIENTADSEIKAFQFNSKAQEAKALLALIVSELETHPDRSLAILVRSRSQLTEIIKLLRENRIAYQGNDIDLLSNLPHVRDAWSLTQALLFPANRLAWLALLRSPFCGLSLPDIHRISQFNKKKSIYLALLNLESIALLTEEGLSRARYFIQVMHYALSNRYQKHLSDWVIHTLNALQGHSILTQSQQKDLEQFWALLDRYEDHGRISDLKEFLKELNSLYSKQVTPSGLQVMTIHKSKGLEFDTVFLPGLGVQPKQSDKPLLRWLKLPSQQHGTVFLVSPIKAAHIENDSLYDYLGQIDDEKARYETQRLLYVAATRAKSRLYLFDYSSKNAKGSFKNLLHSQDFLTQEENDSVDEKTIPSAPRLLKLPLNDYVHPIKHIAPANHQITISISTNLQRLTGLAAHRMLQWICTNHPRHVDEVPWNLANYELKQYGLNEQQHGEALSKIKSQISQMFADTIGRWLLSKHQWEKNEYEILVKEANGMSTRIIDRVFKENESLWIIDFKTGKDSEETLERYQNQVNEYATYLAPQTKLKIHCGLYFLNTGQWVHWMN